MANRRLLNGIPLIGRRKNIRNYDIPLFTTLVLVSCLTLINCASSDSIAGHHQVDQQRWSQQPEYSASHFEDDDSDINLIHRLPSGPASASAWSGQDIGDDNFIFDPRVDYERLKAAQNPRNYEAYSTSSSGSRLSEPNYQQIYEQLILSNELAHAQADSPNPDDSSQRKPYDQSVWVSQPNILINAKTTPYYFASSLDQSQKLNNDRHLRSSPTSESRQSEDFANELGAGQARDAYELVEGHNRIVENEGTERPKILTTLLEDEVTKPAPTEKGTDAVAPEVGAQTKDESSAFGKVIDHAAEAHDAGKAKTSWESPFTNLYLALKGLLISNSETETEKSGTSGGELAAKQAQDKEVKFSRQGDLDNSANEGAFTIGSTTKQRVSETATGSSNEQQQQQQQGRNNVDNDENTTQGNNDDNQGNDNHAQAEKKDKTITVKFKDGKKQQRNEPDQDNIDLSLSSQAHDSKRDHLIEAEELSEMKKLVVPIEDEDGKHKISFLQKASLMMPFRSHDESIQSEATTLATTRDRQQSLSLLGKYIYAPEHHYHLNGGSWRRDHALDADPTTRGEDEGERFVTHKSYPRHRPGDRIQGSYPGLRPIYGSQNNDDSIGFVANQSNDLYFLVMVGAFCVMATAMVLAAGLFAYRVQQNKKTNNDTDYPTYGVVGPNNMNGKCNNNHGFVGGYFGGHNGLSIVGIGNNKHGSGTLKQSPDAYSPNDSGIAGSGGKGGCKKSPGEVRPPPSFMASQQNAARMYHYQHQKQQMLSSERTSTGRHTSASDLDSEDENEDENYTVYECPGLASAHDMEIKNPLFNDDRTP